MEQPIIPPVEKQLLKSELTPDKQLRMTKKSHNQIFIVDIHDSPNVVREIGRQREEVFYEDQRRRLERIARDAPSRRIRTLRYIRRVRP